MAKILKCPRCQEKIDVSDLSGGSTVRCEACGTMVRISGGTQAIPKAAAAPAPAPAPAAQKRGTTKIRKPGEKNTTKVRTNPGAGRQTDLFRKMSSARSPGEGGRPRGGRDKDVASGMSPGVMIGIAAAVIVLIGGAAYAVLGKKDSGSGKAHSSEGRDRDSAGEKKKKKDEPKPTVRATVPVSPLSTETFTPGARASAGVGKDVPDMKCNPDARQAYEGLVTGGKIDEVVNEDYKWILYVFDGLLSDNEAVVKGTCEALHKIILKRKLDASQSDLGKSAVMQGVNSPKIRGDEYTYWAQWWMMLPNRNAIATWAEQAGADPSAA